LLTLARFLAPFLPSSREASGAPAAERPHAEKGFAGGGAEEKL
jgi:hypothetical protein